MPKIPQDEYPKLKAFVIAWIERFPLAHGMPPEHHPVTIIEKMEEQSAARARLGLGMVIKDFLEWAAGLDLSEIQAIDRDFSSRGIVTTSELLARFSKKPRNKGID